MTEDSKLEDRLRHPAWSHGPNDTRLDTETTVADMREAADLIASLRGRVEKLTARAEVAEFAARRLGATPNQLANIAEARIGLVQLAESRALAAEAKAGELEAALDAATKQTDEWFKVADERRAKVERLERALAAIANPVAALKKWAEGQGRALDGGNAVMLSNDPHYLKQIAARALSQEVKP